MWAAHANVLRRGELGVCRSSEALGVAGGAQLPRAQREAVGEGCVVWGWAWVFSRVCEMCLDTWNVFSFKFYTF